jgi:hypothetical protein
MRHFNLFYGLRILPAIVLLVGCTYYNLVPAGKSEIDGAYTVNSKIEWSKMTQGHTEMWTVDGLGLQQIRYFNGLTDGDKLFPVEKTGKMPEYKSEMSFLDVKELVETSATVAGVTGIKTTNFRPFKFGSLDGFRAEFSYTTEDGLFRDGFVVGTKKDKKLYMIMYDGARIHYFPKHRDEAEAIVRSIQMR